MTEHWTLTTSGACVAKAGLYANSTIIVSGAWLEKNSDEIEGYLNALTRQDWVTNYSSVGEYFKPILDDYVSSRVAMRIIMYDMSGYIKMSEPQTMLSVLNDEANKSLEALKTQEVKDAIAI
jgi:hypothetical protein